MDLSMIARVLWLRRALRRRERWSQTELVTVLFSRTIPLVRYEMTDRVRLATQPCPCGLPFRLLESIEGRTDDVLTLPAPGGGTVRVHPVVFGNVLDLLDAAGWQVRQHERDILVLVAAPGPATTNSQPNRRCAPHSPRPAPSHPWCGYPW